jgi:hypothetical protein
VCPPDRSFEIFVGHSPHIVLDPKQNLNAKSFAVPWIAMSHSGISEVPAVFPKMLILNLDEMSAIWVVHATVMAVTYSPIAH